MSGTKAGKIINTTEKDWEKLTNMVFFSVHQCLFCPQIFGTAIEKDDHILEHFAQEMCSDCDQSLIRIGSHMYTIHDVVTCVKRESKPDVTILNNKSINQNHDEWDSDANPTSTHDISDEQMCIKIEPEAQDDSLSCVNMVNIEEMCYQNSDEIISTINETPSNPGELKMDSEAHVEQFSSVDVKNDMDFDSSQVSQSQSHSTSNNILRTVGRYQCRICKVDVKTWSSLNRHMKTKHDPNFIKLKCGYCWALFMSEKSLDKHLPHCKRLKKSIYKTQKLDANPQGINNDEHSIGVHLKIVTDTSQAGFDSNQLFCESTEKLPKVPKKREYQDDRVPCEICGELFRPFNMERHKIYKHRPEVIQCTRYECAICQRVLNNRKSFLQHMRLKHKNSTIFKCHLCSVVLMSKESLDNHHRLRCKRIEEASNETADSDLVPTVNDEKDRYCDICQKSFARANGCERHKFRVHKIGGHHCIKCKQVFHTATGLINHGPKCKRSLNATFECYICRNKYHSKR